MAIVREKWNIIIGAVKARTRLQSQKKKLYNNKRRRPSQNQLQYLVKKSESEIQPRTHLQLAFCFVGQIGFMLSCTWIFMKRRRNLTPHFTSLLHFYFAGINNMNMVAMQTSKRHVTQGAAKWQNVSEKFIFSQGVLTMSKGHGDSVKLIFSFRFNGIIITTVAGHVN